MSASTTLFNIVLEVQSSAKRKRMKRKKKEKEKEKRRKTEKWTLMPAEGGFWSAPSTGTPQQRPGSAGPPSFSSPSRRDSQPMRMGADAIPGAEGVIWPWLMPGPLVYLVVCNHIANSWRYTWPMRIKVNFILKFHVSREKHSLSPLERLWR